MSTITLPNIRVSSDLTVKLKLKDGGVALDWSTLQNIKVSIYSDAQRALAGRCGASIDAEDPTLLVCTYAANKPQYVGVNRVVVSAKYMGETKTYDKPAFNFVRWTDDQAGEQITIEDPDIDVEISVEDVSSSILQEAIDAAFQAAADAEAAAHLVPLEVLQDCVEATGEANAAADAANAAAGRAPYIGENGNWFVWDVETGAYVDSGEESKGDTGDAAGFGTFSVTETEDGGDPSVTVQTSGPDTAKNVSFQLKNFKGDKGDKGDQGNSGYQGAAGELEVVNNLTDGGSTAALSAEMGKTLKGEVSQLEAKVTEFVPGESFNKFNKDAELIEGYVSSSGGIQHVSGGTYLTAKVEIKTNTDYAIGFTPAQPLFASLYMAAFDAEGNKISTTVNGEAKTYYGYGASQKTVFKVVNAGTTCFVAFTVKFSTQDARSALMLFEGTELPSAYAPYNLIIPKGKFDASGFVSSEDLDFVEGKIDAVETSYLSNKAGDAIVTTGGYMNTNGTIASTSSWEYLALVVSARQKYTISAIAGIAARLWLLYDANGNQLGLSSDSSAADLKTETITIPEGGATLYVNARIQAQTGDPAPKIMLHEPAVDANKVYVGTENIVDYINRKLADGDNIASLDFTPGEDSFIVSPFNDTYNIKTYFTLSRPSSQSGNPCLNFKSVCLVNKVTGVESTVHSCSDDITPANFNNTFIGANHADSDIRKITCVGHGKTYEDIGSVWSAGGTARYTIVAIIDEDTLWMMSDNIATYPKFRFSGPTSGTLTHSSGATHTDQIVIGSSAVQQFYSAMRVADLSVILDGIKITENGTYPFKHLDICENYDVLNPASVLGLIKAGVGTFTENPNPNSFTNADKVTRHSIVYGFDGAGKWTISTDFIAYQEITFNYFGFTQMGVISGANRKMYIPKALPIGGKDFRQIADFTSVSSSLDFTSDYWENPNLPPDRWMEISDSIAVHSGYLFDYGVGGNNRKDYVQNALNLFTTLKTYPHGIDSKISVNGGDVFSAVVWRSYIDRAKIDTDGIIATNAVEYGGKCYIYADFNATGVYEVDVLSDYVGRDIIVFEKSANVTVLSKLANGKILVKVETASPMYGYLVMQIK